jgi:hypothetical protein
MFLHRRELLRSQVAASGLSVAAVARQAQVREALLAALLSGDEVTCSLGPARRLECISGYRQGSCSPQTWPARRPRSAI